MARAAIIAGGLGTRAQSMTGNRMPKALLPVAGVPIIFRQLRLLAREGVTDVAVLAGHLAETLREAVVPEAQRLGLGIAVFVEEQPLGTAGCLAAACDYLADDDTIVVYGDIVFDLVLRRLLEFHRSRQAVATITAHPNDHPETSDLLVADENGRVHAILPRDARALGDYRNLVPAAVYVIAPAFFDRLRPGERADFVKHVFPRLIVEGAPVYAYNTPEYLRDIGTPERHAMAERDLKAGRVGALNGERRRPAVFFDCDGVLNQEPGGNGVLRPDEVQLNHGAAAAVRRVNESGWLAVGITNWPQVAQGLVTAAGLQAILGRLETLLARDGGVLDRLYVCPHHPDRGFQGEVAALKIACDCRKPAPGMLRRAAEELPIDPARSAIIGDSWRDVGAGHAFGLPAYGVRTGAGCRETPSGERPDLMFENVAEAVDFVLGDTRLARPVLTALSVRSPSADGMRIVAICGRARAGKSVLAHAVARALGDRGTSALHVRLDDWIVPAAEREPGMEAFARNRVAEYRGAVKRLRRGEVVSAPSYDPYRRGAAEPVCYDPGGKSIIILDGIFTGHDSIRDLVDLSVFVTHDEVAVVDRFRAFYRWKGLADDQIDGLLAQRARDEWPRVDSQRAAADLVLRS